MANGLLRIAVARDSPETEEVTTDFVKRDELYLVSAFDAMQRHSRTSLVAALPSTVYVVPWSAFSGVFKRHPEVLLGLFELAVEQSARLRLRIRRSQAWLLKDLGACASRTDATRACRRLWI